MSKPLPTSYPEYFDRYIKLVPGEDLLESMKAQQGIIDEFFEGITEETSLFHYADGKWTIKEILQHIIDAERIFVYRALCIARKEKLSLPAFDENEYTANSRANHRTWNSLCTEIKSVRHTTICLFESFTDDMLDSPGLSNELPVTVNALGFITLGHLYHHKNVIEERYLGKIDYTHLL